MSNLRVVVLDTETTGMEPDAGAKVLELATINVLFNEKLNKWHRGDAEANMIQFDGEIPPESRAVHHIGPEMVTAEAGAILFDTAVHNVLAKETENTYYAAHNAAFDMKFLPDLTRPWICTYRCAMALWPQAPKHSNQTLRYWLKLEPPEYLLWEDSKPLAPHRAMYDTAVTSEILLFMLQLHTPEELVKITNSPILLQTVRFGKHENEQWSKVPKDYLRWILRNGGFDADVEHTARFYLEN